MIRLVGTCEPSRHTHHLKCLELLQERQLLEDGKTLKTLSRHLDTMAKYNKV